MRIFISEADGYVGRQLVRILGNPELEHEIVGSLSGDVKPAKLKEAAKAGTPESGALAASAQGVVIDLVGSPADATAVIDAFREAKIAEEDEKVMVAVSSVMCWARTKQPRDGDHKESNFRRRKPATKYADVKVQETYVMSLAREGLRTHVLGAGIMYGGGEKAMHSIFKEAWICERSALRIPSSKDGSNSLPTVHVGDLARLAAKALEEDPEKPYMLAVDDGKYTLSEVVGAVSAALGPGGTELMEAHDVDALLLRDPEVAVLQARIVFDTEETWAGATDIEWAAKEGIVEHAAAVAAEYVKERNLRPVRVAVLGPPAAGKSTLAAALAEKYYVPVVSVGDALDSVRREGGELGAKIESLLAAKPRLSTKAIARVVRATIQAPKLRNRGFILDGFPRSYVEADALYTPVGEDGEPELEEEEEEEAAPAGDEEVEEDDDKEVDPALIPTAVIILDGEDELLSSRVLAIEEAKVEGTHNTEEGFTRRLHKYRAENKPEDPRATVVFFEKRSNMEVLELTVDKDTKTDKLVETASGYVERGGKAFNYHPTEDEIAAAEAAVKAEEEAKVAAGAAAEEAKAADEARSRKVAEEQNRVRMTEIARQEGALLEARSAPLRAYLVDNVIPTLTEGLLEVCKVAPPDPVDFLAEFLFQRSPPEGEEMASK